MRRYRVIYGPLRKPKGPWHRDRLHAVTDAIDRGWATRDKHNADRLWWDPLASIEEQE